MRPQQFVSIIIFVIISISASAQTITLYPPTNPVTKKYDEGQSCFSFKYGRLKKDTKGDYQLGYGFLSISEQDWFGMKTFAGGRSVIKDLGKLKWEDSFTVPVLEPLPEMEKDKPRSITIDSSADTHQVWAKTTNIFAKVALGHIYAVHIKDETADFYALFRVEEFEQGKYCTISWRLTPAPKAAEKP